MKIKSVFILLSILSLLLLSPFRGHAQQAGLQAGQTGIRLSADSVYVTFGLCASHLKSDYRMDLTPVVYNGEHRVSLPPVRLGGKRSLRLQRRERLFTGKGFFARRGRPAEKDKQKRENTPCHLQELPDTSSPQSLPVALAADTLFYTAVLPYESWMSAISLRIDGILTGCCSSQTMASVQVAADVPLQQAAPVAVAPVAPSFPEKKEEPVRVLSPARELARHERFIRPAEEYSADRQRGMYHRDPDGLRIYFRLNRHDIDTAYMDNAATLHRLEHVLSVVRADSSVRISSLLVVGYASIEGSSTLNSRLAASRADALKAFAAARGIDPAQVETVNMGEGWDELRDLAARADSLPYREEVLRIIDTVPVSRGREKRLMDLRGGVPYRWMAKHLFAHQRNAGYIRLYYTDATPPPPEAEALPAPDAGAEKE